MGQSEIWKHTLSVPFIPSPAFVIQDDFGRYRIDIDDHDTPGFESRQFAEAVAARHARRMGAPA